MNDANLEKLAKAEAECINRFFKEEEKPQQEQGDYYVVKKGDTLSKIAKANGITLAALLRMNQQITNASKIYPGDKIRLK